MKSRGWYTAELRKVAKRFRRTVLAEQGLPFLILVSDQLFRGEVLEEKIFAVMLLEDLNDQFGPGEFKLLESWIDRISSWADHDSLVHYLIGPMVAADDKYLPRTSVWARKRSHLAASGPPLYSLIHSARVQHKNFAHIQKLTEMLLPSQDDMVQKGLGWLLREAAKANQSSRPVPCLIAIREGTPRLVLRTHL